MQDLDLTKVQILHQRRVVEFGLLGSLLSPQDHLTVGFLNARKKS